MVFPGEDRDRYVLHCLLDLVQEEFEPVTLQAFRRLESLAMGLRPEHPNIDQDRGPVDLGKLADYLTGNREGSRWSKKKRGSRAVFSLLCLKSGRTVLIHNCPSVRSPPELVDGAPAAFAARAPVLR
jgi:hypothetical protein